MNKAQKIKASLKATREKRHGQRCFVVKLKVNSKQLARRQAEQLKMMFVEGKWLYNSVVQKLYGEDGFKLSEFNPLVQSVERLDRAGNPVESELQFLPGSCKQAIAA